MKNDTTHLSQALQNKVAKMPKVEIHVHVEGATGPETFYALAQKNKVKLPVKNLDEWKDFFEFRDFPHFIQVYITAVNALQKAEDYAFLIEQFYKYQAQQNIVYTEAFLSATFMVQKFKTEPLLEALAEGMKQGEAKYGCKINFIPDIARQLPQLQGKVTDLVIEGFKKGLFVGLGVGGLEIGYPPELFVESYQRAKAAGLHLVAHAGEAVGAESIWGAIRALKAERIGHGIRCVEDAELLAYLRDTQLPVEVSPWSNYCLGVAEKGKPHPIRQMMDAGVYCTVNSDDPAMFSTTLKDDYLLLYDQGFTWQELWQMNCNALEASFLEEKQKAIYRKQFEEFIAF